MKHLKQYINEGLFDQDKIDKTADTFLTNYFELTIKATNQKSVSYYVTRDKIYDRKISMIMVDNKTIEIGESFKVEKGETKKVKVFVNESFDSFTGIHMADCVREIDFSHFDGSNITSLSYSFSKSGITKFDPKKAFINSKITTCDAAFMFTPIKSANLENVNLDYCESLNSMFSGCESLVKVNFGTKQRNTKNLKDIYGLFNLCHELTDIAGFENLDFSNIKQVHSLFSQCRKLKTIDFGKTFTSNNIIYLADVFRGCYNLIEVKGLDNFEGKNVNNCQNMFSECYKLEKISLPKFNPDVKLVNYKMMFYNCKILKEINLPSLEIEDIKSFDNITTKYFVSGIDPLAKIHTKYKTFGKIDFKNSL
jgi:hypothetical protein